MPEFRSDLNRMAQPLVFLSSAELADFISQAGAQVSPVLKKLGLLVRDN